MNKFLVVFVVVVAGLVLANGEEEKYTDAFDHVDIDEILNSERLITSYAKCLLNKGPCTDAGLEFKKHIPDALKSECSKCTERQKAGAAKVLAFLITKRPKLFADLEKVYDPTGIYRQRYLSTTPKPAVKNDEVAKDEVKKDEIKKDEVKAEEVKAQ